MYVLDTDLLSLLEYPEGRHAQRLQARLDQATEDVVTTIVTYEEQTRGWFALMAKARSVTAQIDVYRRLRRHLENYRSIDVLDFDERAAIEYQRLRSLRLGIGTMDLKIGAIALANSAVLLTRSVSDFKRIPNLVIEDWTA